MNKGVGLLRLMRPANIVTAISDIWAGVAVAASVAGAQAASSTGAVILLTLSTVGLYGGGVVLNDVFDAELDRVERPERPIPRGVISVKAGALFGTLLLAVGIGAAAFVHTPVSFSLPVALAIAIAIFSITYNKWMKHHSVFGPVNMGICRGLNLLLGMSIMTAAVATYWYIAFIPVVYIGAITMISRGEVQGGNVKALYGASILYAIVIGGMLLAGYVGGNVWLTLVFLIVFAGMIFLPLRRAIKNPVAKWIGKAVKAGVISLIVMNAGWAAAFGMWHYALLICLLLPFSLVLGKLFAVT